MIEYTIKIKSSFNTKTSLTNQYYKIKNAIFENVNKSKQLAPSTRNTFSDFKSVKLTILSCITAITCSTQ